MRFSLLQNRPNSMYLYSAFNLSPAVPALSMEAFVAPANFNPDAQELNIVKAFTSYPDERKIAVFLIGNTETSTTLFDNHSYAYTENDEPYVVVENVYTRSITWTEGSVKRHIIELDVLHDGVCISLNGVIWAYFSTKIERIYLNNSIKYVHFQSLSTHRAIDSGSVINCPNLTGDLYIGENVESIPYGLDSSEFSYNLNFDNIYSLNSKYVVEDNVLYDIVTPTDYRTITSARKYSGPLTLNPNTTWVNYACFYNTNRYGSLILPQGLKYLGNYAFHACSFSGHLDLVNVETIGYSSLAGNQFSEDLIIPDSVLSIYGNSFLSIPFSRNLTIGNGLKNIPVDSFNQPFNGVLTIGSGLETISKDAFGGAFGYLSKFTHIICTSPNFVVEDEVLYQKVSSTEYIAVASARGYVGTLTLSPYMREIYYAVIYDSGRYGALELPLSLEIIGSHAFNSSGFTGHLNSPRTVPPTTAADSFYSINKDTVELHVPVGYLSAYQSAPQWGAFTNIIADL